MDGHAHADPSVVVADARRRLPFDDGEYHLVYSSHLLEHLERDAGLRFLGECHRVLAPGGVIRCVVPDLESLVQDYLGQLQAALAGDAAAKTNHEWAVLALFDQVARERPGGEMLPFLARRDAPSLAWVFAREGSEMEQNHARLHTAEPPACTRGDRSAEAWRAVRRLRPSSERLRKAASRVRGSVELALSPRDREALRVGRFRDSGEVHRWMYDQLSLRDALEQAGFVEVVRRTPVESYVADWRLERLDTEADGAVYKPSSLYMEALKPCA